MAKNQRNKRNIGEQPRRLSRNHSKETHRPDSAVARRREIALREKALREERSKLQGRLIEISAEIALLGEEDANLLPVAIDELAYSGAPLKTRRIVYRTKAS